jgi:beta-N-acetylhexosaminidase
MGGGSEDGKHLRERAGRYLIVGIDPEGTGDLAPCLALLDEVRPLGVVLFTRNLPSLEATLALTAALAEHSPGLLLAIDHEGGRVHRLPEPFTKFPPMLTLARSGDPGLLREVARAQADELRAAGFHVNFAPVLDVHTNPVNPIIGDRAFGTTPEEVTHHALPYLQGLTEGGIIGCGKHFPGHGDTSVDSHLELPRVDHNLDRLRSLEFVPFARAIAQGVAMIMTAHILCPALDANVPASLSRGPLGHRRRRRARRAGGQRHRPRVQDTGTCTRGARRNCQGSCGRQHFTRRGARRRAATTESREPRAQSFQRRAPACRNHRRTRA